MFEDYVGLEGRQIEFVGRFERLTDDLVEGLKLAGETFDEKALRAIPAFNQSPLRPSDTPWPEALRREVLLSEFDALKRFGYLDASLPAQLGYCPSAGSRTVQHRSERLASLSEAAMRILHALHDFLPRHRAGSELYAFHLARTLAQRHEVTILCAEYDPTRAHGSLTRRTYEGLPVVEARQQLGIRRFRRDVSLEDSQRIVGACSSRRTPRRSSYPQLAEPVDGPPDDCRQARHSKRRDAARLHVAVPLGRAAPAPC